MHEILRSLGASDYALDLGCDKRSFSADCTRAHVVRVDREIQFQDSEELVVQGDAIQLPFADDSFAGIVSNHSLEHFDDLAGALSEIGRVVRSDGALFISVPDASTFCDKTYRWLARGGGHVNPFTSSSELAARIERATGLKHVATKTLFTSLSFLNSRNWPSRGPRRLMLLGGGREWTLFLFAWVSRTIDRRFGWRSSVYGWALYFGTIAEDIDTSANVNVCLRCGSGTPSGRLKDEGLVTSGFVKRYRCPQCGTSNPFAEDES